jgi:hypothetical protein
LIHKEEGFCAFTTAKLTVLTRWLVVEWTINPVKRGAFDVWKENFVEIYLKPTAKQ